MREPSFGPTPLARVNALLSPVAAAAATCSGVKTERIDNPTFGPTPEIAVNSLKQLRSARL